MAVFTFDDFAGALYPIRPKLCLYAMSKRSCHWTDAEDLVGDAVRLALLILPQYDPDTGEEGLLAWMKRILGIVIMRDRERDAESVETVPIETAIEQPAPPPQVSVRAQLVRNIRSLPWSPRVIVQDWLDGYSREQTAIRWGVHPNTVTNRRRQALQTLRINAPENDDLAFRTSDFDFCSKVTIYTKPVGVWRSWMHTHPPELRPIRDPRPRPVRERRQRTERPSYYDLRAAAHNATAQAERKQAA